MRETIAHADLLNRIKYNKKTGQFFSRKTGNRLGYIKDDRGQRSINICGKKYPETRLAVFYIEGKWPIGNVKHTGRSNSVTKLDDLIYNVYHKNSVNIVIKPSIFDKIKSWFSI
jgi:hypothetical protein